MKPLKQRCADLTGIYETSVLPPNCYAGLTGNFDGAGISCGFIQFNFGTGTLQPIIRKMFTNHDDIMKQCFSDNYQTLKDICQPIATSKQVAWADSISSIPNNKMTLIQPWRNQFKSMLITPECQQYQTEAAQSYFDKATQMFNTNGLWSERGYALMFDIAVQMGSISKSTQIAINSHINELPKNLSVEQLEIEKMKVIAHDIALQANPKFVDDVRSRKMVISLGFGNAHGQYIDLEKQFGITLNKAVIA